VGHHIVEPVPSLFTFNIPIIYNCFDGNITFEDAQVKNNWYQIATTDYTHHHWDCTVIKLSAWAARDLAEKILHISLVSFSLPAYLGYAKNAGGVRFNIAA
jgi:hypothetical protein